MKNILTLIICLIGFTTLAQAQMQAADKENFKTIALSNDKTGMPIIKKWIVPVRYKVYRAKEAFYSTEIDSIFSKIKVLTGLDIAPVSNDDDVNFSVFLGNKADFGSQISADASSYFNQYGGNYYKFNNKGEIFQAIDLVTIASYHDQRDLRNAIRKSIIKLFGFQNPLENKPGSIFYSQSNGVVKFDNYDSALIRLLYSPRLVPGMNLVQVDEVLSKM